MPEGTVPGHVVLLGDSAFDNGAYVPAAPAVIEQLRAILRTAFEAAVEVIGLRLVCSDPADHASPIQPSERGGMMIARAIARAVATRHPDGHTEVFVE